MKLEQSDDRGKEGEEGDCSEQDLVVSGSDVSCTPSKTWACCDSDYGRPLSTWGWELETRLVGKWG